MKEGIGIAGARDTVGVVGLGAVGTVLAAALAEAQHPVVVCGRRPLDQVEITDQRGTRTYPVRSATAPEGLPVLSWVLLTTKIHQTTSAAGWLRVLAGAGGHVVVAQNGVDHRERIEQLVSEATVVPALVYINAERTGPGRARARRTGRDLVLPDDSGGRAAARLFQGAGLRVETDKDFITAAWRKLLTNVAANPLTALTGRRLEVLREPAVARLATRLLREAVAVGQAEGAALPDDCAEQTLALLQQYAPGSTTSMLQDREAGRPLEYEGLTGAVVRFGDKHGVPVETNRAMLTLLAAQRPSEPAAS